VPISPGSWVSPSHRLEKTLQLSPNLLVLGTRNTADRTIARMDIAIRRRFAFIEMWPDKVREGGMRRVAHRMKFELLPLLRSWERAGEPSGGDLAAPRGRLDTVANVTSCRRRVRLILASVPFGYRSPEHEEGDLGAFRELLGG